MGIENTVIGIAIIPAGLFAVFLIFLAMKK
jgi:hypothetical protein